MPVPDLIPVHHDSLRRPDPADKKRHIQLAVIEGYSWRVWENDRGQQIRLNRIAPVGHCIRP